MGSQPVIVVIGAGINGRMVQHLIPSAIIYDWNVVPPVYVGPRFYGANYLWKPIPGIDCRHVRVWTTIDGCTATPDAVINYKTKVGKAHEAISDEDIDALLDVQFKEDTDGWELTAYPDCDIRYGAHVARVDLIAHRVHMRSGDVVPYDYLVSTIPLPSLLSFAGITFDSGLFRSQSVKVRVLPASPTDHIHVDYITDPLREEYRSTHRNSQRHDETLARRFTDGHGGEFHTLSPGKIWDTDASHGFRMMLADHHVKTVGRYGSWCSDELVHDTVAHVAEWALNEGLEVSEYARLIAS